MVSTFCDLDVQVGANQRARVLETAKKLGFKIVAFNTVLRGVTKLTEEHVPKHEETGVESIKVLERLTLVIEEQNQVCTS